MGIASGLFLYFVLTGPEYWLMRKGVLPERVFIVVNYPFHFLSDKNDTFHRLFDAYLLWWNPVHSYYGGVEQGSP